MGKVFWDHPYADNQTNYQNGYRLEYRLAWLPLCIKYKKYLNDGYYLISNEIIYNI